MLTANQLCKSRSGRVVLDAADVSLSSGRITVVLGPNGAGKSTLLKCLSFVDPPDAGSIILDGRRVDYPDRSNAFRPWPQVTAVFQGLHLWPHLKVRQNILLPAIAKRRNHKEALTLPAMVELFGLTHLLDRFPNELSGGERMLAALCRAVMLKPRYLLLDEPTASLDIASINRLAGYLQSLAASGVGILVVTHMLGFAKCVANDVLFMDEGRIVERGGAEVLNAPTSGALATFVSLY